MEKKRIVVVDDMPNILDQAKKVAGERYQIIPAMSGAQAIEIAREIKPDLILLDIYMPEMDGFECLSRLKGDSKTRKIPVIIITTDTSIVTETKGFTLGAADFIRKPFTQEIMFARIEMQFKLVEYEKIKEEREKTP